jgi:hypothetical protein
VLGDVHRGIDHGRRSGDVGRGLRAVGWERVAGQAVQVALAVLILLVLPSPLRAAMPDALAIGVAALAGAVLVARFVSRGRSRLLRTVADDLRAAVFARHAWPGVVLASMVVVSGHVATFLIAARAVGSTTSTWHLVPLAVLALLAMAVPLNIGGWGPREGIAAWAFAAAGLGADRGVAAATVYGVLVFAACLPGAAVLVLAALRRRTTIMHEPSPERGSVQDHERMMSAGSGARG